MIETFLGVGIGASLFTLGMWFGWFLRDRKFVNCEYEHDHNQNVTTAFWYSFMRALKDHNEEDARNTLKALHTHLACDEEPGAVNLQIVTNLQELIS